MATDALLPRSALSRIPGSMTPEEARAHYNFLLTLCIRKAESFGPMAFTFLKDHSFPTAGLTAEEQFNLLLAVSDAFAPIASSAR